MAGHFFDHMDRTEEHQSSKAAATFFSHEMISMCWGQALSHWPQATQSEALPWSLCRKP